MVVMSIFKYSQWLVSFKPRGVLKAWVLCFHLRNKLMMIENQLTGNMSSACLFLIVGWHSRQPQCNAELDKQLSISRKI